MTREEKIAEAKRAITYHQNQIAYHQLQEEAMQEFLRKIILEPTEEKSEEPVKRAILKGAEV